MTEKGRPGESGASPEGVTILALQPLFWEWGESLPPPGVVVEARDSTLTAPAWRYLSARLMTVPPTWPREVAGGTGLRVRRLVLAAGMAPPARFGEDGWLVLSDAREVAAMAALLLNPNGLHFLNHARHRRFVDRWPGRVDQLHAFLARQQCSPGAVVFDDGLVMELYGLRPSHDIAYLSLDELTAEPPFIANDAGLVYHGIDKRALIEMPRYHLEVDGLKFVSFARVRRFKLRRRGLVDRNDLAMMAALETDRPACLLVGAGVDRCLCVLVGVCRAGGACLQRLGGWPRRQSARRR